MGIAQYQLNNIELKVKEESSYKNVLSSKTVQNHAIYVGVISAIYLLKSQK